MPRPPLIFFGARLGPDFAARFRTSNRTQDLFFSSFTHSTLQITGFSPSWTLFIVLVFPFTLYYEAHDSLRSFSFLFSLRRYFPSFPPPRLLNRPNTERPFWSCLPRGSSPGSLEEISFQAVTFFATPPLVLLLAKEMGRRKFRLPGFFARASDLSDKIPAFPCPVLYSTYLFLSRRSWFRALKPLPPLFWIETSPILVARFAAQESSEPLPIENLRPQKFPPSVFSSTPTKKPSRAAPALRFHDFIPFISLPYGDDPSR